MQGYHTRNCVSGASSLIQGVYDICVGYYQFAILPRYVCDTPPLRRLIVEDFKNSAIETISYEVAFYSLIFHDSQYIYVKQGLLRFS